MSDDSAEISPIRLARWIAVGLVLCFAIVLYFRFGTNLPAISANPMVSEGVTAPVSPAGSDSQH